MFFSACSDKNTSRKNINPNKIEQPVAYWLSDSLGKLLIDSNYLFTGFYFLAEEKGKGVRKRQEQSNEIYAINSTPFASVKRVVDVTLKKTQSGGLYELCMTMDDKGTAELAEGTNSSKHDKIAVIIANRLLYVPEIRTPIRTGKMCILLEGYTIQELEAMLQAVRNKK